MARCLDETVLLALLLSLVSATITAAEVLDFSNKRDPFGSQSSFADHVRTSLQNAFYGVKLNMSHNGLEGPLSGLFLGTNITTVTTLDLSHNSITSLDSTWFLDFPSLEVLNASHNLLTTLDADLGKKLGKVHELVLSFNQITELSPAALPRSLRKLTMSHNRVRFLAEGLFTAVELLSEVDLSHNHISYIPFAAFKEMPGMRKVDVSYNRLRVFEPWPYRMQFAEHDLSHNFISAFSNAAKYTVSREKFYQVNLSYNNLTRLHSSDFSMYLNGRFPNALEVGMRFFLNLTQNPFICDCHIYWVLKMMKENMVSEYRDARSYFTCDNPALLRGKTVGDLLATPDQLVCRVEEGCPQSCSCLDTPHYGYLAVTCDPRLRNYTCLPLSLPAGSGPMALDLTGHALRHLQTDRPYLDRLQVLNLRSNQIEELPASLLDAAQNLKQLDLRDNALQTLPPNLQRLSLNSLLLRGNPLRCTCDLVWFGNWVKAVSTNMTLSAQAAANPPTSASDASGNLAAVLTASEITDDDLKAWFSKAVTTPLEQQQQKPNATTLGDAFNLTCQAEDGRRLELADTEDWGLDCRSLATLRALLGAGAVLALVVMGLGVCWRWRYQLWVLLHFYFPQASWLGCRMCLRHRAADNEEVDQEKENESPKTYDLFVSIDESDVMVLDFITHWMLPFLENRTRNPLRAYLPLRQELPGASTGESRSQTISQSRKVLVLLSKGYATNAWCRYEFDSACRHVQQHNEKDLVIVLLDSPREVARVKTLVRDTKTAGGRVMVGQEQENEEAAARGRGGRGGKKNRKWMKMPRGCRGMTENAQDKRQLEHEAQRKRDAENLTYVLILADQVMDAGHMGKNADQTHLLEIPQVVQIGDTRRANGEKLNGNPLLSLAYPAGHADEVRQPEQRNGPHQQRDSTLPAAGPADPRPGQAPGAERKQRRLKKHSEEDRKRMEELSQFLEDGQLMALEPLRTFLLEGRYLSAGDWLFKHKLLYALSKRNKQKRANNAEDLAPAPV